MIPAREPIHRPVDAKLLFVRRSGALEHRLRRDFVRLLRPGDLVIANDAATLPASLTGVHVPSGRAVEVRLAARSSLDGHSWRPPWWPRYLHDSNAEDSKR